MPGRSKFMCPGCGVGASSNAGVDSILVRFRGLFSSGGGSDTAVSGGVVSEGVMKEERPYPWNLRNAIQALLLYLNHF
jgi:hypothetical protein